MWTWAPLTARHGMLDSVMMLRSGSAKDTSNIKICFWTILHSGPTYKIQETRLPTPQSTRPDTFKRQTSNLKRPRLQTASRPQDSKKAVTRRCYTKNLERLAQDRVRVRKSLDSCSGRDEDAKKHSNMLLTLQGSGATFFPAGLRKGLYCTVSQRSTTPSGHRRKEAARSSLFGKTFSGALEYPAKVCLYSPISLFWPVLQEFHRS